MSTSITETFWYGTLCHCLITLAACILGLGFCAAAFFMGREHAQAEYTLGAAGASGCEL